MRYLETLKNITKGSIKYPNSVHRLTNGSSFLTNGHFLHRTNASDSFPFNRMTHLHKLFTRMQQLLAGLFTWNYHLHYYFTHSQASFRGAPLAVACHYSMKMRLFVAPAWKRKRENSNHHVITCIYIFFINICTLIAWLHRPESGNF